MTKENLLKNNKNMKSEVKKISIESPFYKKFGKAFEYALEQTRKEINQAVEGMYHNLNTLQSRSMAL